MGAVLSSTSNPQTPAYLTVRHSLSPLPYRYGGGLQYALGKTVGQKQERYLDHHNFVDE